MIGRAAPGFALPGWIRSGAALVLTLASTVASPAAAGPNSGARLALHLMAPTAKSACERADLPRDCAGIVTSGDLYPRKYFVYLLVTDADSAAGVAGVQCGVDYSAKPQAGFDVFEWKNCATLEFPSDDWPAPGGGNLITWDSTMRCQRPSQSGPGVAAVAGYFYGAAYSPDMLFVIPRPVDGCARVAACSAVEDTLQSPVLFRVPEPLGLVVFSAAVGEAAEGGYNPCGAAEPRDKGTVVAAVRWSQLQRSRESYEMRVQLPHTFRLGPDKALYADGVFYGAGESMRLEFDPTDLTLRANGVQINRWTTPRLRRGDPPLEDPTWITVRQAAEEAAGRFRRQFDGTEARPRAWWIQSGGQGRYGGQRAKQVIRLIRAVLAGDRTNPEIVLLADSLGVSLNSIRGLGRAGADSTAR